MDQHALDGEAIFTIPAFLAPEECAAFIARGEQIGFEEAKLGDAIVVKEYRDNDRATLDDPALAEALFARARPFLPDDLEGEGPIGFGGRFRFYRYSAGQKFAPHYDGSIRQGEHESRLTFMVYLNDDCTGGATNFLDLVPQVGLVPRLRVRPERGTALVFVHRVLHEGAAVEQGQKYVLRTDVLYGPPADPRGVDTPVPGREEQRCEGP